MLNLVCDEQIETMLFLMDKAFRDFERNTPSKPRFVELSFGHVYRYEEQHIYQAIIQKLARVNSLLRATILLLNNGFIQEQAILKRAIDETNEDITFLIYAITIDTVTDLHKRYLEAFWEEEVDESGSAMKSQQKRAMIPRKKIHAYLAKNVAFGTDSSIAKKTMRTIHRAFSGFVHGASPQIMEMYGGNPPHFHTKGMLRSSKLQDWINEFWHDAYRSFMSHIAYAKALGEEKHFEVMYKYLKFVDSLKPLHR
jgi:hypothetical protein